MGKSKISGQSSIEATKKSITAKTTIDKDVSINIKKIIEEKNHKCTCCGEIYDKQQGNFMPSNFQIFKGNNFFISTCKKCTDQLFIQMTDFYGGNEEKAIDHICMMYGLYFHESPLSASKKISAHRGRLSVYSSKVQINPWVGLTYLDTIKNRLDFERERVIESIDEAKDKKTKQKTVRFFGVGFSDEDYEFLENEYLDWTTRHECSNKAQEEVFKQICFTQLELHKAQRKNENTKDLMKTLQELLSTANLQPKQTKDNTLTEQNTFGTLIKKWENEQPIPEPDEEWKDVDGIVRYITVYFLGHLCKMMGIKNSYSRMYEDEMSKYKVDKPEYEDDDEALFDSIFSQHMDGDGE